MSGLGLVAVDYARRGWRVFPCHAPAEGACSCGAGDCPSPAKHPRTRRGLHDASAAEDVVARWWRRWPGANVGLRTGDGLVVVDVDPAHGGADSLAALEADHGALPATATVRTGSGGLHVYFRHDGPLRNSAGALGPGLDVRADGGYVIAPPSWHVAGAPYRWTSTAPLAPLPGWVLGRLTRPAPPRPVAAPPSVPAGAAASAWAAAALAGEVDRVVTAAEGQRNHTLNRAAFVLGQVVGGGHLDAAEVADLLERAGEAAGLGAREAAATVASGLAAGARWPRHPRQRPAPGAPTAGRERTEAAGATPPAGVSLDAYVEQCAARLWRPDGENARRWLGVDRGLPDEVLAVNRVGADPGAPRQARPASVAEVGPAVVVPALDGGRLVAVHLRPLAATGRPASSHPGAVVVQPPTARGPCVVVTDDVVDALSASAGGYRAAAVQSGADRAMVAALLRLGAPLVLAVEEGSGAAEDLGDGLVAAGARVARLVPPGPGLNAQMLGSHDWPRELAGALRCAWACQHRSRRLVR
ncbi:MAG: bifunctional DNA primase/polymerase [Acidimicrobiia bacterium]